MTDYERRRALARKRGTVKRIHVNKQKVKSGEPAITIQTSAGPIPAREVQVLGQSTLVHSPDDPISSGARVWLQTLAPLNWSEE